jgi:hypothetical protein
MHKNEEGIYTLLYFDKHGRHLKEADELVGNLHTSIEIGRNTIAVDNEAVSFLVKRNVYNSIDH